MKIIGAKKDGEIQVEYFVNDILLWTREVYQTAEERHTVYSSSDSDSIFQPIKESIDFDSLKKEGYELIQEETTGRYDRKTIIRTPASFVEILETDTDFSLEIIFKNYAI